MRIQKCPDCHRTFTKVGMRNHVGSKRCKISKDEMPRRLEVEAEEQRLLTAGKLPWHGNAANAITQRGLEEFVGLEKAETKWYDGGGSYESVAVNQWWAYSWVVKLWNHQYYRHNQMSRAFYDRIEAMSVMDEEELERARGLVALLCH